MGAHRRPSQTDWGLAMGLTTPYFAAQRLPPALGTPLQARKFIRRTLGSWGGQITIPDVVAVANELVTNAVCHAFADITNGEDAWLGLSSTSRSVLCAVTDPSPTPPRLLPSTPLILRGRGLRVVDALSLSWGYTPLVDRPGKVVWAHVPSRSVSPRHDGPH
ncbi:ATP-binding protein [Streptomyces sp. NPDC052236]|uniref:ATP-binding protein n=1 Tax=Streptomyces sp. NPDC052236 TaxID=3365686 RepID=UPI0037D1D5AA